MPCVKVEVGPEEGVPPEEEVPPEEGVPPEEVTSMEEGVNWLPIAAILAAVAAAGIIYKGIE